MSAPTADIDRLYQVPLEEFTRARNELAAQARAHGETASAKEIKALAKPSVSAWTVNQLFWHARRDYDVLMKAGERLREVQQAVLEGRRGDLRKVSEARQAALVAALDRTMTLAAAAGHPASPALRQRVARTLEALAAYGGSPPNATPGRLSADLDPPGFSALAGLTNLEALKAEHGATKLKLRPTPAAKVLPHNRELARARPRGSGVGRTGSPRGDRARRGAGVPTDQMREIAEAEREAKRLRGQAARAEVARHQAAEREEAARQDLEEAHRTLERAKERAKKAAEDLRAAEKNLDEAERAAAEAETVVADAKNAVTSRRRLPRPR